MKPLLTSRTELAKTLGVSRTRLYQMEAAGCPFPAGKCHLEWALEWLKNNPNFRADGRRKHKTPPVVEGTEPRTKNALSLGEAHFVRDLVYTALFLRDLPNIVKERGHDILSAGEWDGVRVLFGHSFDRTFAVVFDLDGSFLGVKVEGKK